MRDATQRSCNNPACSFKDERENNGFIPARLQVRCVRIHPSATLHPLFFYRRLRASPTSRLLPVPTARSHARRDELAGDGDLLSLDLDLAGDGEMSLLRRASTSYTMPPPGPRASPSCPPFCLPAARKSRPRDAHATLSPPSLPPWQHHSRHPLPPPPRPQPLHHRSQPPPLSPLCTLPNPCVSHSSSSSRSCPRRGLSSRSVRRQRPTSACYGPLYRACTISVICILCCILLFV
jgi:hypothetical protein